MKNVENDIICETCEEYRIDKEWEKKVVKAEEEKRRRRPTQRILMCLIFTVCGLFFAEYWQDYIVGIFLGALSIIIAD